MIETLEHKGGFKKRNGVGVADVLYEAVASFVAKCEAGADLEEKVIKFLTVAKVIARRIADSKFEKHSQLFISVHNERLARCQPPLVLSVSTVRRFLPAVLRLQLPWA